MTRFVGGTSKEEVKSRASKFMDNGWVIFQDVPEEEYEGIVWQIWIEKAERKMDAKDTELSEWKENGEDVSKFYRLKHYSSLMETGAEENTGDVEIEAPNPIVNV